MVGINTNNVSNKNTIIHSRPSNAHKKLLFFLFLLKVYIYIYKRYVYMKATDDELFRGYSTTWRPKLIFCFYHCLIFFISYLKYIIIYTYLPTVIQNFIKFIKLYEKLKTF